MARFKLLLTLPETLLVILLITAFRGNKEKSDEYEKI